MRVNKTIDASIDEFEEAKSTVVSLIGNNNANNALDLFYTDNLEEIESGLKKLNKLSSKSWILSSLILYTVIYNESLYQQSGLAWNDYLRESRERIGIDQRDISEQLSAARFFIKYNKQLLSKGFDFVGANRKLARAELALEFSGDVSLVIEHIVNDSWREFQSWYQSFKVVSLPSPTEYKRDDIVIDNNKVYINKIEAVTISTELPQEERDKITDYITQIFEAIQNGYEPAIVPVYDSKEAKNLLRLRDNYRQKK